MTAFPSRPDPTDDDETDESDSSNLANANEDCSSVGFMDLSKPLKHIENCSCGFANLRKAVHNDLRRSSEQGLAYESPLILAALILHHSVCILLASKSRNAVTGMHVEATFRNRIAEAVSYITPIAINRNRTVSHIHVSEVQSSQPS